MIMIPIREIPVEKHPWPPFLPANARILMLGSFPPKPERWCMDFFYPNWLNDMWRIMGKIFYADKDYFTELPDHKRFDRSRIEIFLREKGIALYDTATEVRRLKDNASDKFSRSGESYRLAGFVASSPAMCCSCCDRSESHRYILSFRRNR